MSAAAQPRHAGRFDSSLTDEELLAVVREVLEHASPAAPHKVSTRKFDAARVAAGHAGCPSARAIWMRLNKEARKPLDWAAIKTLALNPTRSLTQTRAAAERAEGTHLTEQHVYFALRYVGRHLEVEAPTRDQYASGRERLLATAKRRGDESLEPLLPTVGQIERLFNRDWDAALKRAKLTRERPKAVPPPRPKGMPVAEVTAHFVKLNGWWPTKDMLAQFAREADIKMQSKSALSAADTRKQAADLLVKEGISLPAEPGPPADAKQRAIKLPASRLPGTESRETEAQWNRSACVDAMARWIGGLGRSAKTTKAAYVTFQRGRPDYPAVSAFDDHGGFGAVKKAARAQLTGVGRE